MVGELDRVADRLVDGAFTEVDVGRAELHVRHRDHRMYREWHYARLGTMNHSKLG